MTALTTVAAGTGAITDINDNFIATSPAGIYGRRAAGTSGLTWGYYGGIAFDNTIADGTVALTASNTNYVVADRATGAVSASTSNTNWNDTADYYRLYLIVAGASAITSYVDHRDFTGGGSGGGGSNAWGDLTGVPAPIEDIAALTDPGADRLLMWDDSAGEYTHATLGTNLSFTGTTLNASGGGGGDPQCIPIACSDETTDLTTGAAKVTFRMPFAFTLTEVRASLTGATSGSVLTVDINQSGTTILSTKLTIDVGEKSSTTAATPVVISNSSLSDDAEITIDIDTIGSTGAGTGLKVYLIGTP